MTGINGITVLLLLIACGIAFGWAVYEIESKGDRQLTWKNLYRSVVHLPARTVVVETTGWMTTVHPGSEKSTDYNTVLASFPAGRQPMRDHRAVVRGIEDGSIPIREWG